MPDSPELKSTPKHLKASTGVVSSAGSCGGGCGGAGGGAGGEASADRQLAKLKRFLATLQQFAADVSPEAGEKVHALILALVSCGLSVEEFQSGVGEATNYPIRPFVAPLLRSHLPLLQAEVGHLARMAKQTPQQYVRNHALLNTDNKRCHDLEGDSCGPPAAKRRPPSGASPPRAAPPLRYEESVPSYSSRLDRYERLEHLFGATSSNPSVSSNLLNSVKGSSRDLLAEEMEDEWKNIHTMLSCILGMVEKTKRALSILQQRSNTLGGGANWTRQESEQPKNNRYHEMAELRRRPEEEAVAEVKRQAVAELQKAVEAAESKAGEMLACERAKMERRLVEARRQAAEEALQALNRQDETQESCWNCGRKASETCSGCNVARYCGAFCQHKDWENHHRVCGVPANQAVSSSTPVSSTPAAQTPPTTSLAEENDEDK